MPPSSHPRPSPPERAKRGPETACWVLGRDPEGDQVKLAPEVGVGVTAVESGRALVLRGGVPMGAVPPPYDFTWAFVLREQPQGTSRLLVRERYAYTKRWAPLLVEPTAAVAFVMSQRMLRGIRDRAERASRPTA